MKSETFFKHFRTVLLFALLFLFLDLLLKQFSLQLGILRAIIIGLIATIILFLPFTKTLAYYHPFVGGVSIFLSTLIGSKLINSNLLVTESIQSAIIHFLLIALFYILFAFTHKKYSEFVKENSKLKFTTRRIMGKDSKTHTHKIKI